jgi:aminopeptidase
MDLDAQLARYAELIVRVGLNLADGQRLLIIDPSKGGTDLRAAPLVRHVVRAAYRAGSPLVEVVWADEALQKIRFEDAPDASFDTFPPFAAHAFVAALQDGAALLNIHATDPSLLADFDPALVGRVQKAARAALAPGLEFVRRNAVNWLVVVAATPAWAARVYPDLDAEAGTLRLWETIFRLVRLDRDDPIAAWQQHNADLAARSQWLTQQAFTTLHYRGPGTELTIGLPEGALWASGASTAANGITFNPNLPTEEVFTLPHRLKVDGTVQASKPLPYGGVSIEDFRLTFKEGKVVEAHAAKGEDVLRKLLETDDGSAYLGEVALVPHSSPVSQAGVLFYDGLLDENAACHLALGAAYPFTLKDADGISADEFAARGGNNSSLHLDFMIGSGALDIDGTRPDGSVAPLLRSGEWAF